MPILETLREFFAANNAEYSHSVHPAALTARQVASAEHLPAREVAKTVVVAADEGFAMVVVPASTLVDFHEVRQELGFSHIRMATEQELGRLFPDCELGAMPPAGPLYNMPVFLDASLAAQPMIAFNAGTHRDVIHMRAEEFRRVMKPAVLTLARVEAAHGW